MTHVPTMWIALLLFLHLLITCALPVRTQINIETIAGTTLGDLVVDMDAKMLRLRGLIGACHDPMNGHIYLVDETMKMVFKIDGQTNVASRFAGNGFQSCHPNLPTDYCGENIKATDAGVLATKCSVDPSNGDV